MLSENIKKLRNEKGMTQKELADELHVTAQAVSRWETGEVEPSVGTLTDMSKIFNVTVDEIIDNEIKKIDSVEPQIITKTEYVIKESKPVLAVCERCNKPIYDGDDIVRYTTRHHRGRHSHSTSHVRCKACDNIIKEEQKKQAEIRRKEIQENGKRRRKKAFWWSLIITVIFVAIAFSFLNDPIFTKTESIGFIVAAFLMFPFISCLILKNNFIGLMVWGISSFGFIKLPGLIFSLDLDGIIWLITVKLAFWLIELFLSFLSFIFAIALGLVVSLFVYPFALTKSIKHPEETNF